MRCRAQYMASKFPPLHCRVVGKHWQNKVCPPCTALGITKKDDMRLKANRSKNVKETNTITANES